MSTAEILSLVSLISYILAGVFLLLAVFFWFFFKIPAVIGALSGRTAKKSIEKMRQTNARNANKGKPAAPVTRSPVAQKAQTPAEPSRSTQSTGEGSEETAYLGSAGSVRPSRSVGEGAEETAYLGSAEETTLLVNDSFAAPGTAAPAMPTGGKKLTMITDVMLIHTDEVI